MKNDSKGIPDVCREQPFGKFSPEVTEHVKFVQLQTNAMIHHCRTMQAVNKDNPEVGRLLSLAVSAFEEASMWAVKGLTSEGFKP